MNVWRPLAGLVSVLLATGVVATPGSAAGAHARAGGVAAGAARGQAGPPQVPCPTAKIPPVSRPPRPSPPAHEQSTVGGERLATTGLTVPPGTPAVPGNKLSATSWLVADLDSGEVLGGCGPHEYGTPASVQKLLLAAAIMPKLDAKQVIQVSRADLDIEPGSSAVGLVVGGKYPVEILWLGLLLQSGNDAANTLARLGGGAAGVKGGVAAMNAEAGRLGAFDTHAVTPSGLDGRGQFTSAYDLALIARACFALPDFRKYDAAPRAQMPAQPNAKGFQIQNENTLLTEYKGALGGKTGFTNLARHSYVGAAERNGRRLVVTLLGAEAQPVRGWQQGAALLDWGFSVPRGASVGHLVTPDEVARAATPTPDASVAGPRAQAEGKSADAPSRTGQTWSATTVGGLALVVFALPVVLLVVSTSRRRRRAALRRVGAGRPSATRRLGERE
jgi:D-alanyl-D-alanine carboxypeptidase (penicillin-binding protein 5/6)